MGTTQFLELPELTADQLGNRETARKNSMNVEAVVKIPLDKIVIRTGFNVRQDFGNLQELAHSILENGQSVPGRVDVLADGTFVLTDGHRRFMALQTLAEMGQGEGFFKAIVNGSKTTEQERILQMFTTQDNKQLEPYEVAELIKRLLNLGYNQNEVARKIGKTGAYVSQMLSFANESPIIKKEVVNGNLTVSAALKLQKKLPKQSERVAAVEKAVAEKKPDTGTLKVEDVTGKEKKAYQPIPEADISAIRDAVFHGRIDYSFINEGIKVDFQYLLTRLDTDTMTGLTDKIKDLVIEALDELDND